MPFPLVAQSPTKVSARFHSRENCGNVDAKQLTKGSRLFVPVAVDGGLYSAGDGHFAQGDGEVCITAIEMGATAAVRFVVHKGEAARPNITFPRFAHPDYFLPPEWAAPRNFIATMGFPIRADGTQEGEGSLSLAARNALLNMIAIVAGTGLDGRTGLHNMQRGRGPAGEQHS